MRAVIRVVLPWTLLALVATPGWSIQSALSSRPGSEIYNPDPQHLWNRLHETLLVRVGPSGREYGRDRVDPLLWVGSTYLLQGASHEKAVGLLNEFVATHAEKLIVDPLKRAILQRDLWMVADWLDGDHVASGKPMLNAQALRAATLRLRRPLNTAVARLALTPPQIRQLPDNYAASAAAGGVPSDLFAIGGPWVSVGPSSGPVAPSHVNDEGPGKNSVFLVFIRLPGGRDATLKYLNRLRSFDEPLWMDTLDPAMKPFLPYYPNPDVPQFPAGTQVALVRRALLIDSSGEITPSRLTESVQLRTYRRIGEMTPQVFLDAHRTEDAFFARAGQDFREFRLSRAALFSGRGGGLMPVGQDEKDYPTFSAHGNDAFDEAVERSPGGVDADAGRIVAGCHDCHSAPGIYSFNSHYPFRLLSGPASKGQARLSELSLADAERIAVSLKRQRPEWRALKPLLMREVRAAARVAH
ncbi:MAG TPA: hypothetical protein VGZ27_00590 [Vicinamibacterales bacterium]|nr:hypothetical protein [Vicinamibacterales bacterium]